MACLVGEPLNRRRATTSKQRAETRRQKTNISAQQTRGTRGGKGTLVAPTQCDRDCRTCCTYVCAGYGPKSKSKQNWNSNSNKNLLQKGEKTNYHSTVVLEEEVRRERGLQNVWSRLPDVHLPLAHPRPANVHRHDCTLIAPDSAQKQASAWLQHRLAVCPNCKYSYDSVLSLFLLLFLLFFSLFCWPPRSVMWFKISFFLARM